LLLGRTGLDSSGSHDLAPEGRTALRPDHDHRPPLHAETAERDVRVFRGEVRTERTSPIARERAALVERDVDIRAVVLGDDDLPLDVDLLDGRHVDAVV